MRIILVGCAALCLAGCGLVERWNEMTSDVEMGKSEEAYKQCIASHPVDSATACENARLIYQADVQALSARTGTNVSISGTSH